MDSAKPLKTLSNTYKADLNPSGGHQITFLQALQLMFIYLKLTEQIDWHWLLVFMPMIIPVAIISMVAILTAIRIKRDKKKVSDVVNSLDELTKNL